MSFLRSLHGWVEQHHTGVIVAFIVASTAVFVYVGRPVKLLVLVGALNGLILPASLAAVLIASRRAGLMNGYRPPAWLTAAGAIVAAAMLGMGGYVVVQEVPGLWR